MGGLDPRHHDSTAGDTSHQLSVSVVTQLIDSADARTGNSPQGQGARQALAPSCTPAAAGCHISASSPPPHRSDLSFASLKSLLERIRQARKCMLWRLAADPVAASPRF